MRPAFGGKALWKVSLNTKSAAEANILFLQANAALEQQFEEIRVRIKATGEPLPSQRDRASDMIAAYFQGPERDADGLDGTERLLLARLEIDRGLWNMTPTGCSPVAASSIDQWWALANNVLDRELHRLDWSFLDWDRLAAASQEIKWDTLAAAIDPARKSRS
jgi:hypothetical protein